MRPRAAHHPAAQSVETMAVQMRQTRRMRLVVLTVAVFAACAAMASNYRVAEAAVTAGEIRRMDAALLEYQADWREFPPQGEGLTALVQASTSPGGRGPYLDPPAVPLDSWQNPYVYAWPGKHHPDRPDLYSKGEDGMSSTGGDDPDDINNWDQDGHDWYKGKTPVVVWIVLALLALVLFVETRRWMKRRDGRA